MNVIRPADPARAVATALAIHRLQTEGKISAQESSRRFELMLTEQPYALVGVYSPPRNILDDHGRVIGEIQPGDSFTGM